MNDSDDLSADSARTIARTGYMVTYPLVMYYRTMYVQAIDPASSSYAGGFGTWLHLGVSSPDDTDIVTPNNDTPYSYAWVDLRAEPQVLTLPPCEGERYYTSQWNDLWGFVLDNPGSVLDGNDGGDYLLAGPDWDGPAPDGIRRVIRGESQFLGTLSRVQLYDMDDLDNVRHVQQGFSLQPLSSYLGTSPPDEPAPIDWPQWDEGAEATEAFWSHLAFLLQFVELHDQDAGILAELATIGITAGAAWRGDDLPPDIRDALAAGMEDARNELLDASQRAMVPTRMFQTRATLTDPTTAADSDAQGGFDYFQRSLGVWVGIFGNWANQAVYLASPVDEAGEVTDGSKWDYTMTFPAGRTPPVKYFWSMTMYRLPERWLVANPIDRYSIGSRTPGLVTDADGALTIYIQASSPGPDRESNWLPSPNGPFWIVLRTYGPSDELQTSEWPQPPIVRAGEPG